MDTTLIKEGSVGARSRSKGFAHARTSTSHGFTLIELLVVIAIIGLLAAVVLASVGTARSKGVDASVKSQLDSARQQAELYASSQNGGYSGVCAASPSATPPGLGGTVSGGILYNAGDSTGNQANITTAAATAGAYNYVTCHSDYSAYMIEAPLTASASGAPDMWCVDSNGASKEESSNVAANSYSCP